MTNEGQIFPVNCIPGFVIPSEVRSVADPGDYILMIDSLGVPYKITKANFNAAPSIGSVICTTNAPIVGAGKAFEFTSLGTFSITVDVAPGAQITNDTQNASRGTPIIVHQWTQIPNANQTGKIEPRIASLPQIGGSFNITVTNANKWLILAARHPGGNSNNYYYDTAYFTFLNNKLTIVGF